VTEAMTNDERNPGAVELAGGAGTADVFAAAPETGTRRRPGRARRIAAVSGAALVTVAAIGVSGFTWVTVRDADRDAGKPVWEHAEARAETGAERPAGKPDGLRAMLLGWDEDGLTQGPDMDEFGSDDELNGKEAAELAKENFKELPRSQRKQIERAIDKRRMKGVAMRSYTVQGSRSSYATKVVLTRVSSEKDARSGAVAERGVYQDLQDLGIGSAGPKVPGHAKNAWCYVLEADKKGRNESVLCVGHHGDVTVTLTAFAPRPIEKKDVAGLMGKQLDRIETPGEAV
jgi:hypothetical protein